jgi:hypothetical protein
MRTLRPSVVGTVILVLAGGVAGAAVAQSEEPTDWATPVSGSRVTLTTDETGVESSEDEGYSKLRGLVAHETWAWSDPRLPADATSSVNGDGDLTPAWQGQTVRGAYLFEGPEGYWSGTYDVVVTEDGIGRGMLLLTGHGRYDGQSAMLVITNDDPACVQCQTAEGYIYPRPLTPMPGPIAPAAG